MSTPPAKILFFPPLRWDVPDEEQLAEAFSAASRKSGCSGPPWSCSGQVDLPGGSPGSPGRALSIHMSTQLMCEGKTKELLLLAGESSLLWSPANTASRRRRLADCHCVTGATLRETSHLASVYSNVIPVTSSGGHMTLLDLTAPFLFRGRKRFYGCVATLRMERVSASETVCRCSLYVRVCLCVFNRCKRCSSATLREPYIEGQDSIDEKFISEGEQQATSTVLQWLRSNIDL